jgi:hypothetical protein
MSDKKIIMYNSDEAAKPVSLDGWLSSDGYFYPNGKDPKKAEEMARFKGCTHKECECGGITEIGWLICRTCRDKKDRERYEALEYVEYTGQPVCIWDNDEYFFDDSAIESYIDDYDLDEIDLLVCEPVHPQSFDYDEHYADEMPEDTYFSDICPDIADAFEKANELIRLKNPILSWQPGKKRTTYKRKN